MTNRPDDAPFAAVIADMDGVLTRTATLHERAWRTVFDELLPMLDATQPPFSSEDYRAHVDGKPRYDGVADFLAARGLELPLGDPDDAPARDTVCGVGNRKNAHFLALLEHAGVEVFDDARLALERWRRAGLAIAAVSASRNARHVLRAARLEPHLDTIVDGVLDARRELGGKRGIFLEAARLLGVEPRDAVILEDASAGVRAGREAGFGLVAGIAREPAHAAALREAGAHTIVDSLARLRFRHRVPHALERRAELEARRHGRSLAVFLDYDGTLSPIVRDPADAVLSEPMRGALVALAARCPVAIISGRDRRDVEARVGMAQLYFAGNHGFDIAGPGHERVFPEAEAARSAVRTAGDALQAALGQIPGVIIERKRYSVAVHYRQADTPEVVARVDAAIEAAREATGLRRRTGKKVVELEPALDWHKGRALRWLVDVMGVASEAWLVLYVGDDETDEDAFAELGRHGLGVRVGPAVSDTLADYRVADPDEVRALLDWLATDPAT